MIELLDLSHHNRVDSFWEIQKSGVPAVIHKATQGSTGLDDEYKTRKERCLQTGMLWGAYHFGTAAPAAEQAAHFLKVAQDPHTLMVLDWEGNAEDTMARQQAEHFVLAVHDATGRWPVLYSGESFLRTNMAKVKLSVLTNCHLWVAKYSAHEPSVPALWGGWDLWQYTSSGTQTGVAGNVDRNRWQGSLAALKAWWAPCR